MQLSNWLESTTNSWKAVKTNSIAMKHNLKGSKTAATEKRTFVLNILQECLRPHITQGLIKQPIKNHGCLKTSLQWNKTRSELPQRRRVGNNRFYKTNELLKSPWWLRKTAPRLFMLTPECRRSEDPPKFTFENITGKSIPRLQSGL